MSMSRKAQWWVEIDELNFGYPDVACEGGRIIDSQGFYSREIDLDYRRAHLAATGPDPLDLLKDIRDHLAGEAGPGDFLDRVGSVITNEMDGHTAGPWRVEVDQAASIVKGYPMIVAGDGYEVVTNEGFYGDLKVDLANAHVIAATPDMWVLLQEARRDLSAVLDASLLERIDAIEDAINRDARYDPEPEAGAEALPEMSP